MNRAILFLVCLALSANAGCRGGNSSHAAPTQIAPGNPLTKSSDDPKNVRYMYVVQLKLATIEVPLGTASGSEEIWGYLDEERTRAVRTAALGRNGFLIGVAGNGTWPDLAKILQRMTGRQINEQSVLALPGRPFPIELKIGQGGQTIFTSYQDRTLSGADYPAGDNLLTLSCTLDEADPSTLIVTGVPQIRSTQRSTGIVREAGGLMIVSRPEIYTFTPVTFQLSLKNKDLLVIGPSAESRRPTSIAHHFLIRDKDSMQFETVLVLIPEIVKAPLRDEPAASAGP